MMKKAKSLGMIALLLLLAIFVSFGGVQTAKGDVQSPWPMFQHDPQHTGIGEGVSIDAENVGIKWEFYLGMGQHFSGVYGSPIIDKYGTIYVGSASGKLYALNPDGTEKWNFTTDAPIAVSPILGSDGTIYFSSDAFYAVNSDGTLKWKREIFSVSHLLLDAQENFWMASESSSFLCMDINGNDEFSLDSPGWGTTFTTPVVGLDGTIYVAEGGYDSGTIYAIDPNTKNIIWEFDINKAMPTVSIVDNEGNLYLNTADSIYSLYPNGTLRWEFHIKGGRASPAVGSDGTIYVGSYYGYVYAVNSDGTLKWKIGGEINKSVDSSPIIGKDGTIYVGMPDGNLYAISPDGTVKWKTEISPLSVSHYSPMAMGADGTIYVAVGNTLYAIGQIEEPGNETSQETSTPGFEALFSIIAMGTTLVLYRKKKAS